MIHDQFPGAGDIAVRKPPEEVKLPGGYTMHKAILGRKNEEDAVPGVGIFKGKFDKAVIWVHPEGKASLFEKGELSAAAKALLDHGCAIVAPDVFQTGELKGAKPFAVNTQFAGYTFGYNRPVLANRVHDILTSIGFAKHMLKVKTIYLVGWEQAGPWAVLAGALSNGEVKRIAVDLHQFRFENVTMTSDEMMLPGAVKYGGLPAFLALCAPQEVLAHNHRGTATARLTKAAYEAAGAKDKLQRAEEIMEPMKVVEWLLK
jgi:hypothetical protein